ncbi:hypothetical protein [Paenibacillus odorifer]|uniref:hypothetical protein n=1 Tax=Paenibacillus odorifer TaxID=189426 RepID=UPI0020C990B1|nr:hypothetical protein [Paenibacillus odorifer]
MGIGWSDGIYLKIGGYKYNELNKPLLISQFWLMTFVQTVFSLIFILFTIIFGTDSDKTFILIITSISGFFLIIRSLFYYVLEATNRIKEFALINLIDRILYFVFTLLALYMHIDSYKPLILVDMFAKIVTVIILIYICKDMVFGNSVSLKTALNDARSNISIGIKLLLANIASTLIIGIVRWAIELKWDIETFGKVSLTLSISNLLMLFVNSVGVVMFPMLRQSSNERLPSMYIQMRTAIMLPLLACLVFYYPVNLLLSDWLPQYTESLKYMAIILPICIFESKISMLINTYLKTLRKERTILMVNVITLLLSLISTVLFVFILRDLTLAVFSIYMLLAIRCILAEILLSRSIKINVQRDIILEVTVTLLFILSSWFIGGLYGFLLYLCVYIVYFLLKRKDFYDLITFLRTLLLKKR